MKTIEDVVKIVEKISASGCKARLAYVAKQDEWVLEVDDPDRILSKATFTSDTPQKACKDYLGLIGGPEREIRLLKCYVVSSFLQPDRHSYSLEIQKKSWRELHEHDSWLILKSHITVTGGLAIAWQDGEIAEPANCGKENDDLVQRLVSMNRDLISTWRELGQHWVSSCASELEEELEEVLSGSELGRKQ